MRTKGRAPPQLHAGGTTTEALPKGGPLIVVATKPALLSQNHLTSPAKAQWVSWHQTEFDPRLTALGTLVHQQMNNQSAMEGAKCNEVE